MNVDEDIWPAEEWELRLSPAEVRQVEEALGAETAVNPRLAALVREVDGDSHVGS